MMIYGAGADSDTQDLLNCARPIKYSVHIDYSTMSAFSECSILIIYFNYNHLINWAAIQNSIIVNSK